MKQDQNTSSPTQQLYARFSQIHENKKDKLPKTDAEKLAGKIKGVVIGLGGTIFGVGIAVLTKNIMLGFGVIMSSVYAADRLYAPEDHCYSDACEELRNDLKLNVIEGETTFQKIQRSFGFGGENAKIIKARNKDFKAMFGSNRRAGLLRMEQCPDNLEYIVNNHKCVSDLETLIKKNLILANRGNFQTEVAEDEKSSAKARVVTQSRSNTLAEDIIEVNGNSSYGKEAPEVSAVRSKMAPERGMAELFKDKTLVLEKKALKSVACASLGSAKEVAEKMQMFCSSLKIQCDKTDGKGGSFNLKLTMPEGWSGKTEPFTMTQEELVSLKSYIAELKEKKEAIAKGGEKAPREGRGVVGPFTESLAQSSNNKQPRVRG